MGKYKEGFDDFISLAEEFFVRFSEPTWKNFIICETLVLLGIVAIFALIEFLKGTFSIFVTNSFRTANGPFWVRFAILSLGVLVSVLIWARWVWVRNRKQPADQLTIAIHLNKQAKDIHEIENVLNNEIRNNDLAKVIRVTRLPSDIPFNDAKEAEDYAIRKNIPVLLWGTTYSGNSDAGKSVDELRLRLSYFFSKNSDQEQVKSRISKAHARSLGRIHASSLEDILLVSGNLYEISTFALAVCLKSHNRAAHLPLCLKLYESLWNRLSHKGNDPGFPFLEEIKTICKAETVDCAQQLARWSLRDKLPERALEFCDKGFGLDAENFNLLSCAARASWDLGKFEDAKRYTDQMAMLKPEDVFTLVNKAFFSLKSKKYSEALLLYNRMKRLNRKQKAEINWVDLVCFLEKEFEKDNDPAILFAMGYINKKFVDTSIGEAQLRQFIEQCESVRGYTSLVRAAKKLQI